MWEPGQPEPLLGREGLLWEQRKSLGWPWGQVGEPPTWARMEQGTGGGRHPGRQPQGLMLEMHHPLGPVSLLRFPRQRVADWLGLALELGSVPGPEGTFSPRPGPVSY